MWLGLFEAEAEAENLDRVPPDWACPTCGEDRHDYLDVTADLVKVRGRGWEKWLQPVSCLSCGAIYHI